MGKSSSSRSRYRQQHGRSYVFHPACEDDPCCVYCGEPREVWDHFLPIRFAADVSDVKHVRLQGLKFLVPSCAHCNVIAGVRVFRSVQDKRKYIRRRLKEKNAKLLKAPEWTDDEIMEGEIGPTLKTHIIERRNARRRLLARLSYEPGYPIRRLRKEEL